MTNTEKKFEARFEGSCNRGLRDANMIGANMIGADLHDADLRGANMHGANMRGANMRGADMRDANLVGANLSDAHLSGANMRGAYLSGANLERAAGIVWADCSWSDHGECGRRLLGVVISGEPRYFCGCFAGTEGALRQYIVEGHPDLHWSRTLAVDFVSARLREMISRREKEATP